MNTIDRDKTSGNLSGNQFINQIDFANYREEWLNSKPFSHLIIDNFLINKTADAIASEFPDFDNAAWRIYNNQIEVKKLLNHWDKFGQETYKLFQYLNSREFISNLEILTKCDLYADFGLNGGGLHTHRRGGKLNTHLDYSIHPKLKLERRINILIYIAAMDDFHSILLCESSSLF